MLTLLERAVVEMILAGDHLKLATLRSQFAIAEVSSRELSGAGFFTHFAVPTSGSVSRVSPPRFWLGDVWAPTALGLRHGAGFVLLVEDGLLAMLEGYSFDEPWRPGEADEFTLAYIKADRARVLSQLG
jgi:hypothetical protein